MNININEVIDAHRLLKSNGYYSIYKYGLSGEYDALRSLLTDSFENDNSRSLYIKLRNELKREYEAIESMHYNIAVPTANQYLNIISLNEDSEYLKAIKNMIVKNGKYTRDNNGEVLPEIYFASLKSKIVAKNTLYECVENDDKEAWSIISKYEYMSKVYQDRDTILRWLKNKEPKPDSKMFSELYVVDKKEPLEIAKTLINSSLKKTADSALSAYDSSVAKPYGHHIIRSILMSSGRLSSKSNRLLLERLVEDGADLFVGFNMALRSHFVYEPFLSRKRAPGHEADYMNKAILSVPGVSLRNKNNLLKVIEKYRDTCLPEKEIKNREGGITP